MIEFLLTHLMPILPEAFLLAMGCVILLVNVFVPRIKNLPYFLSLLTLIISAVLTASLYNHGSTILFHGQFITDNIAVLMKLFIYVSVFMTFVYSKRYITQRNISSGEYYVLGLFSTLGMLVLVSGHHLLTIYLGLELLSLPLYAMVALQRDNARCVEAAMKFFVVGALASGMLLYGLSLIFGATQSLNIAEIATKLPAVAEQFHLILVLGLVFTMAGIVFKLGAVPFHMWVPDVYDGAPSSVTLFISTAPKIAALGLIIRLTLVALAALHIQWQQIWIAVALLSIGLGNLVAISQTNIKRMLAYSSIAHMGYAVLGLACATPRGYAAALFYILTYSVMTLGGFGMIVLLSRTDFEADHISDLAGLNTRNPWLAFMMLLVMFSMAGVPPLVGFIAKLGILEALIKADLVWLAVVAIIFAIIGSYYYLRVVKAMYFEEPENNLPVICTLDEKVAISLNGLAILLIGVFPGMLFSLCHALF